MTTLFDDLQQYKQLFDGALIKIETIPVLKAITTEKIPEAVFTQIDILKPSDEETVFNMSVYDINGNHVGGAEITKQEIHWDD